MLLRHTLLYLPAQLFAPLAQFAAAVVWTHWMSPETYGVLTFLVAAQDLVFVVSLLWWSAFSLRYYAGFDLQETDRFRRSESAVLALTVVIGALASLSLLAYLHALNDLELVVATTVFLVSRSFNVHFAERARAQAKIFDYTVAQTAGPVFGFLLALVVMRYGGATPGAALACFGLLQSIAALWLARRLGVDLTLHRPDREIVRRAMLYGVPMVVVGVFAWISLNGIRFVVQDMGGEAAMGLLAVGWSLGQRLAGVTAMLVTAAAFPLVLRRLATESRSEAMRQYEAGGTLLFALVVPAAVGLWLVGPALVDLLVAAPFRPVTLAVLPAAVAAGTIRNLRVHYADQSFLLFERTEVSMWISILEAVLVIVLSCAGYRWDGIVGAVLGCLAATIVAAAVTFVVARQKFDLPLPVLDWGRIAVATAIMSAAVGFVIRLSSSDAVRLIAGIAIGGLVYTLSLGLLFPRRALALLQSLLGLLHRQPVNASSSHAMARAMAKPISDKTRTPASN